MFNNNRNEIVTFQESTRNAAPGASGKRRATEEKPKVLPQILVGSLSQ